MFSTTLYSKLEKLSQSLRQDLIQTVALNGGHIGGSLSSLDIIIALYFSGLFDLPKKYDFSKDCFILSAGHLCPALYAVLAEFKTFPKKYLTSYGSFGSTLQGHSSTEVPGVLFSSGALGQGLSFSVGLAIAKPKNNIICLTSDGEHQEGQLWEAVMSANKYNLKTVVLAPSTTL